MGKCHDERVTAYLQATVDALEEEETLQTEWNKLMAIENPPDLDAWNKSIGALTDKITVAVEKTRLKLAEYQAYKRAH